MLTLLLMLSMRYSTSAWKEAYVLVEKEALIFDSRKICHDLLMSCRSLSPLCQGGDGATNTPKEKEIATQGSETWSGLFAANSC